jgi:drug/metabolite transporter (DMT)-like permease
VSGSVSASRTKVLLAFLAVYVIWGSTYLAIRFAIETIPPFLMAGVRFVVAGSVLFIWARMRGAAQPTIGQWRSTAIVGLLLLVGGNGGVVWAEQLVPSGLTALLVATVPLWMVLRELAGAERIDPRGAVVLIGASLAWATGSLYSRRASLPPAPLLGAGMHMLTGGAALLVLGLLSGEVARVELGQISARSSLALAYLIVFGALVGFTAYIWLLRATAPTRVATYAYVNPVVAVVLGWALADEPLGPRVLLAAATIVAAVAVITSARARVPASGDVSPPARAGGASAPTGATAPLAQGGPQGAPS